MVDVVRFGKTRGPISSREDSDYGIRLIITSARSRESQPHLASPAVPSAGLASNRRDPSETGNNFQLHLRSQLDMMMDILLFAPQLDSVFFYWLLRFNHELVSHSSHFAHHQDRLSSTSRKDCRTSREAIKKVWINNAAADKVREQFSEKISLLFLRMSRAASERADDVPDDIPLLCKWGKMKLWKHEFSHLEQNTATLIVFND